MAARLDAKVIADLGSLEQLYAEWDALAVSSAQPLMAPGWLLAWWRHVAPDNALLRAIEIRDGAELVGLAPFFAAPSRLGGRVDYRLLGIHLGTPLTLLSQPGREWRVAQATAHALSLADPSPDLIVLQGTRLESRWHVAMRDGWPGRTRPISRVYTARPHPTVRLQGASLDTWLASRSSQFRSKMRRLRRRFDEVGGTWRMSTQATLRSDIESFQRLHAARWRGRGRSTFVSYGQRVGEMLLDSGRALIADERFRLWVMEVAGEPIAADIYIAAGGAVNGISGGWDERWKPLSPPLQATMRTIEDSIERREFRIDMGAGDESHKTRFANQNTPLAWSVLMTPGRRLAQTFAVTAPMLADRATREFAKRALAPQQVERLRRLRRSVAG
jgi:CelD/BcsL family acetyltransferase involved in cellulose biosynthesis